MKPTIKDVAREAGVSVATVSRIVNGLPGYSEGTRKKVAEVIASLGYKPNAVARNLVNRKTNTIGVLLPQVSSSFSAKLLHGIEEEAHIHQYSVIICNTDSNGKRTMDYLNLLREKQVEGILFASEARIDQYEEEILALKIPVLAVDAYSENIPYLKVNDQEAAYAAAEYLIKMGHQNIGMISGTKEDPISGAPRVAGFLQALADHGIMPEPNLIEYGDFGFKSGYEAITRLIEKNPFLTAIFAASDEMALGIFSYCYEKGIHVPDELSVIGYDDTEMAEMAVPPLTTIHQPIQEMGAEAVRKLITLIQEEPVESKYMPYFIKERKSVRRLS
ncbi:LacI family transcriptional regulator [Metabacillus sp. GX 13764]|uniref:LacI family DNA-binding transcriptional regulator n=1 Tax=Metabacillus kandeliae TaxID=2900151 RepID=UPI001E3CA2A2|nr:LacI family DNA-binding transcriptional regulator [Metabacillus kandeliae]MCD7035194.1 LacI family transcriptional regulator [Metabacillus kandeliae]